MVGFRKAREIGCNIVVTIDGDRQHNPDDIPAVIEPVKKGEAGPCYWIEVPDSQSRFRAISRRAL